MNKENLHAILQKGFFRVGFEQIETKNLEISNNAKKIIRAVKKASENNIELLVFPEFCLSGSNNDFLYRKEIEQIIKAELQQIIKQTAAWQVMFCVGYAALVKNKKTSCAAIIFNGEILATVVEGEQESKAVFVSLKNKKIKIEFGFSIIDFSQNSNIKCVMSAKPTFFDSNQKTKSELCALSSINNSCYVYSNMFGDSQTNFIYNGYGLVCQNNKLLCEHDIEGFYDIDVLEFGNKHQVCNTNQIYFGSNNSEKKQLNVVISKTPWRKFSQDNQDIGILNLQAAALAKRAEHIGVKGFVIGVSGGLDSALALIVTCVAAKKLGLNSKQIFAISMPGFGSGEKTKLNARLLCNALEVEFSEISITEAVSLHFSQIGFDESEHSVTFENAQARERTQILFDVANQKNALFVGTGDLSELALGWCTFGGDHMSQYSVNASLLKSQIRSVFVASASLFPQCEYIIDAIAKTPVSPELLPPNKDGTISQITENAVGPYELQDFLIYSFLAQKLDTKTIAARAFVAFEEKYTIEQINKYLELFLKRFFANAFKRNCMPESPNVTGLSLSAKQFELPSDASASVFIDHLAQDVVQEG